MSDDQRHDIAWAWSGVAFSQESCWPACLPWSANGQPTARPTIKARAFRSVVGKSILLAGLENGRGGRRVFGGDFDGYRSHHDLIHLHKDAASQHPFADK
jgi:hypothetical protein